MLGLVFVVLTFLFFLVAGLLKPWLGVVGFYFFVFLCPEWNWRWAVSQDFGFQKWIFLSTVIGFLLNGLPGQPFRGSVLLACTGLALFLGLAFLSAQTTIDVRLTTFYMGVMWKIVLVALLAVRLLDTPEKLVLMLWAIAIGHGYNALAITREYFQVGYCRYVYHSQWAWTGSNQIANLAVCAAGVSLGLLFYSTKNWQKAIAGILFLLQAHEVMLLESRGCMLGLLGLALVAVWLMPKTKSSVLMVLVSAAGVVVLSGPSVVKEFGSIFSSAEDLDDSADSRFKLWRAGYEITVDYPLLGVGPYAGQKLVPKYYEGGLERNRKGLHNLIFEISTGCGIPATLGFLSFFAVPLCGSIRFLRSTTRRQTKPEIVAPLFASSCGLVGFFICNMFSAGGVMEGSYSLAIIGLAGLLIAKRVAVDSHESPRQFSVSPQESPASRSQQPVIV